MHLTRLCCSCKNAEESLAFLLLWAGVCKIRLLSTIEAYFLKLETKDGDLAKRQPLEGACATPGQLQPHDASTLLLVYFL